MKRHSDLAALVFFLGVLAVGLVAFDDYGITWDETGQRAYGEVVHAYVFQGEDALLTFRERYHGPGFELFLVVAERALRVVDSRSIYLLRHLLTFLAFYLGIVFFYFLCRRYFRNALYGLAGSALLVLSPVVFAHSFYNSKDIPTLSLFTISTYTLLRFTKSRSFTWAVIHAVSSALLMSVRMTGLLVPVLTGIVYVWGIPRSTRKWLVLAGYLLLWSLLTVAFWPTLWEGPIHQFLSAFREMQAYPWRGKVFYMGRYLSRRDLPWHYVPVWIAISTPLAYTGAAVLGLIVSLGTLIRRTTSREERKGRLVITVWFLAPLFFVMVLHSVVYDAWRHLFFIYPAFLILALQGFRWLFRTIRRIASERWRSVANLGLNGIIGLSLLSTAFFMVTNHPLQQVYFSIPRSWVADRFELDYWGASYRQALEHLLAIDPDSRIPIKVANYPGVLNVGMLPQSERRRILLVGPDGEARYFLTNMRFHYAEPYGLPEVFAIEAGGIKILRVFSLGSTTRG